MDNNNPKRWPGFYYDGRTARQIPVRVELVSGAVRLIADDNSTTVWDFKELTQTQGFYKGEPIRLERDRREDSHPDRHKETLVIKDDTEEFLKAVRILSGVKKLRAPHGTKKRVYRALGAAALTVVIIVLLYFYGIPLMAERVAERVPPAWEDKLGKSVADEFVKNMDECKDPALTAALGDIIAKLNAAAPEHPYEFKVYIVKNDMLNAFAAPGGHIIVFSGLIEETERAEELAGVLAHEMQHVLLKHSTKSIFQALSTSVIISLVTGDVGAAAQIIQALGSLNYSREHEVEADMEGLDLMVAAGIDPKGMVEFFNTMDEVVGDMPESMRYVSTHPLTKERIERLNNAIEEKDFDSGKAEELLPEVNWRKVRGGCS